MSLPLQQIGPVDSRRNDPNQHFVVAWLRLFLFGNLQNIHAAKTLQCYDTHLFIIGGRPRPEWPKMRLRALGFPLRRNPQ